VWVERRVVCLKNVMNTGFATHRVASVDTKLILPHRLKPLDRITSSLAVVPVRIRKTPTAHGLATHDVDPTVVDAAPAEGTAVLARTTTDRQLPVSIHPLPAADSPTPDVLLEGGRTCTAGRLHA
jgi:hypothetical protein